MATIHLSYRLAIARLYRRKFRITLSAPPFETKKRQNPLLIRGESRHFGEKRQETNAPTVKGHLSWGK